MIRGEHPGRVVHLGRLDPGDGDPVLAVFPRDCPGQGQQPRACLYLLVYLLSDRAWGDEELQMLGELVLNPQRVVNIQASFRVTAHDALNMPGDLGGALQREHDRCVIAVVRVPVPGLHCCRPIANHVALDGHNGRRRGCVVLSPGAGNDHQEYQSHSSRNADASPRRHINALCWWKRVSTERHSA